MQEVNQNFQEFIKNQVFDCKIHKQKCIYLYLDANNNQGDQSSPLKCAKCQTSFFLDPTKLLSLEEIFSSEDETILDNWPLFGQKNYIFSKAFQIEQINFEETFTFFKGFKTSIINKLEQIEGKLKNQYKIIENNKKLLKDYYNTVSVKENIQNTLFQMETNPEQSKNQFKQYIQDLQIKRQSIDNEINYIYKTLSFYQDYLSTYSLKQFTSSIDNTLNAMEKVVNYEIFDVLESKGNNNVIPKEQKEKFNNLVFYNCEEQLYSVKYLNDKGQTSYYLQNTFQNNHQQKNSQSFGIIQAIRF
ncbi:hypothetical protein ABPG72_006570 [Tetrahymena utriculariae]